MKVDENRRSNSYVATVEMEDGKPVNDDGFVEKLREFIIAQNKHSDKKQYVKLHGRGPREHNGIYYGQELPLGFAETADVYVYERRTWS